MQPLLITGGAGFLGRELLRSVPADWECHVTERRTPAAGGIAHRCDLSDGEAVRRLWSIVRPRRVIHTAYGTEDAERDIWLATRNVTDACRDSGAELLHVSSDLVLDGEHSPYAESAEPAPVHEYGRWKAKAELYVRAQIPSAAVVRASLITSFDPPDPRSAWVAAGLRGEAAVTLYVDEIRSPILVQDLAAQIIEIAALPAPGQAGVWHLAGPEAMSRFALGALIAAALGLPAERLRAGRSSGGDAPRPRDLRLLTSRADRQLMHRARSISEAAAGALAARLSRG
jgi:dTDP-4-dehydrorhamnose reductase